MYMGDELIVAKMFAFPCIWLRKKNLNIEICEKVISIETRYEFYYDF